MFRQFCLTYCWLYLNSHTPLEAPVKLNPEKKGYYALEIDCFVAVGATL
jgi:hypothetical protein